MKFETCGDRDGDDRGEQRPLPEVMPNHRSDKLLSGKNGRLKQDGENGNAQYEQELYERSDCNSITDSGKRLAVLLQVHSDAVPFIKQDVRVLVPAAVLTGLGLGDEDLFTCLIQRPRADEFAVELLLNETPLAGELSKPLEVTLDYRFEMGQGALVCVDSQGGEQAVERNGDSLTVLLPAPGAYLIREADVLVTQTRAQVVEQSPMVRKKVKSRFLWGLIGIVGVAGACVGGSVLFRRMRG